MTDLAKTIAPKSDQLNADDLIGRNITIKITKVRGCDEADQPIAIHFEGDNGKPYKPCKSMRRVMVHCWGADGNTYVGHRMTLFRDESVLFGGIKVGGIRISHMSHIDREMEMALTVTKARRTPYRVKPLRAEVVQQRAPAPSQRGASESGDMTAERGEYARGFGALDGGEIEADVSAAVEWMRGVYEDLDADIFKSTADLDAFFADPDNQASFEALQEEDPALARKLEGALRGRGKALAGRR